MADYYSIMPLPRLLCTDITKTNLDKWASAKEYISGCVAKTLFLQLNSSVLQIYVQVKHWYQ